MATRQYIGARYVPKFYQNSVDGSAAWESNVVYEPLTYVTLTNGHIYLSKKQVPATVGTPSENIHYWLDTGSYNGFIDDLQDQIDTINTTLTSIDGRLDDLEEFDDNWILITDSYGNLYPDTSGTTFIQTIRTIIGRNSDNLVGLAYSGDGFIANTGGDTFLGHFTTWTSGKTSAYKNSVSRVIVVAGRNDYPYTKSAISDAIDTFATYVKNNYPNAEFYLGFIGNGSNTYNGTRAEQYTVYQAFKENQKSIYLSGVEAILKNTDLMAADFIHPNAAGRAQLGKYIAQALMTGSAHVYYPRRKVTINVALAGATGVFNAKEWYEEVIDGNVILTSANIGAIDMGTATIAANGSNNTAYGTCDAKYIKFPVNEVVLPASFCSMKTSESGNNADTGGVYMANITFGTDGNLYLNTFGVVGGSPYNRTISYILFRNDGAISIPAVLC